MFDRKAYGQRYSREKRERRKAEGRCVTCGVKLTFKCTTLQCEHCREKQKYQNVAKVNISKLIAKANADILEELVLGVKGILEFDIALTDEETEYIERRIDEFAKELLESANE